MMAPLPSLAKLCVRTIRDYTDLALRSGLTLGQASVLGQYLDIEVAENNSEPSFKAGSSTSALFFKSPAPPLPPRKRNYENQDEKYNEDVKNFLCSTRK
jgi:hypothetical protein